MTRRILNTRSALGTLAVILAWPIGPAQAQGVFGRVRDRARQAVTGSSPSSAAAPRCDLAARMQAHNVTPDVVNRYIRALQARETEMRRLARENTPVGRYFAAQVTQDSLDRRKLDFDGGTGPDWARRQELQRRAMTGDMGAAQEMSALAQSIDQHVPMPQVDDWSTMNAANSRLDTLMWQAGGFESCDWLALVEFLPQTVGAIATTPDKGVADMPNAGTPAAVREDELAAIKAHRVELARLLKVEYKSDEWLAAERSARAQQDSTSAVMNAWLACRQRVAGPAGTPTMAVPQDSLRVWGQQAQDAQKRGDQAAVMALAQKMQAAMAPAVNQQGMAEARVYQQCGRQPGTN